MQYIGQKCCRCFSPDIVHVKSGYRSNRVALYDLSEDILHELRITAITCYGTISTDALGVLITLVDSSNDFEVSGVEKSLREFRQGL
jgi:hypothetical protein